MFDVKKLEVTPESEGVINVFYDSKIYMSIKFSVENVQDLKMQEGITMDDIFLTLTGK